MKASNSRILSISLVLILIVLLGSSAREQGGFLLQNPKVIPADEFPEGLGQPGGIITIDIPNDPGTFNPIMGLDSSSIAVNSLLHGTLLEVKPLGMGRGLITGGLAEGFEISPDFRIVRLYIRRGVQFSDGQPLTADDVIFTFNVIFNCPTRSQWLINGNPPEIRKISDYIVEITTRLPDPRLLGNLSNLMVLPRHILEGETDGCRFWGPSTAQDYPEKIVGTGPFKLEQYIRSDEVILKRNDYYWKFDPNFQQLPYLQGIKLVVNPLSDKRVIRFLEGETDIYRAIPADLPLLYKELPSRRGLDPERAVYIADKAPTIGEIIFIFNQDVNDPNLRRLFRDIRFRKAMSYALDRRLIIERNWTWKKEDGTIIPLAEPRCSPGLAEVFWIGDEIKKQLSWCNADRNYEANLDEASSLLDEIGLEDSDHDGIREFPKNFPEPGRDVRFKLLVAKGEKAAFDEAQVFKDRLKKIGIEVEVMQVDFAYISSIVFNPFAAETWDAVRLSLGGGGDPTVLAQVYSSCGAFHLYRYSDCDWEAETPAPSDGREQAQVEIDELFEQLAVQTDFEERKELAEKLQWKIAEYVPVIWSVMPRPICAFDYDKLRNFSCVNLWQDATIKDSEIIWVAQ